MSDEPERKLRAYRVEEFSWATQGTAVTHLSAEESDRLFDGGEVTLPSGTIVSMSPKALATPQHGDGPVSYPLQLLTKWTDELDKIERGIDHRPRIDARLITEPEIR